MTGPRAAAPVRPPGAALGRWTRRLQNGANLAVIGTGLVYFVMKYLMEPSDPWAVVNHPWQPAVQHLHVLAAPLLVFAVGLLWQRHVAPGLRSRKRNRRSGLALAFGFVPMAASGYLLQISTGEAWRTVWLWLHLATSGVWAVGYAAHWVGAWAMRRRRGAGHAGPPPSSADAEADDDAQGPVPARIAGRAR